MIHLPPDPHILASFANANLPWWKALAELVDNSLDAGATRVVIDVTNRVLTVSDDGFGCQDITAVFKLGDHKRRRFSKRSLGRYGIGAKDAWLSCADTMEVVTYRGKKKTRMCVSALDWVKNDWNVADPESWESDHPSGTVIRLPLRQGKNTPNEAAFQALAFAFTPAIRRGIQIVKSVGAKKFPLKPVEMPIRDDVVQAEFDVDGRSVKIDIGILPEGALLEQGPFWLIYGHRVIESTSIGAGQYSVRRLAGTITIGEGWSLSKNKDNLTESVGNLADAIFVRIEHVLKKADHLAETIESSALRSSLQDMLNASVKDANLTGRKAKRGDGDRVGSIKPASTGRKHRRATVTQDGAGDIAGPSTSVGRRCGYVLDWYEDDPARIGKFERSGTRVSLNLKNGLIAAAKAQANRAALTACAVSLISDYSCRHDGDGNSLLKFSFSDFAQAMGTIVKDYSEGK